MFSKKFKKEVKNTLKLAIPIIIAQLGVILMGVADNIMVGRFLGSLNLGAAGIGNSVSFLIASFAVGGMSVLSPMYSKFDAENGENTIRNLYRSGLWVAIILSIILSAIGVIGYYSFEFLKQTQNIERLAKPYYLLIIFSNIPLYFFLTLKQLPDGLSLTKVSMYITILGLIINVICNFVFINGMGSIKSYGLNGAGYATIISRSFMLLALIIYINSNSFIQKKLEYSLLKRFDSELIKKIFSLSIPAGFQVFFEIGAFSLAVIMIGWISEVDLAAHQIAINIAATTYMMATGLAYAGGIRVGKNWGNKSITGIKSSGQATFFLIFVFMTITMCLIMIFDETLVSLYIDDPAVEQIAVKLLFIAALFQFSDGMQAAGLGVLRGLADVNIPTIITFIAYWLLALPLGYMFAFKFDLGSVGVWLGLLLGLTFSAIFLVYRFQYLVRPQQLKKRMRS